MSAALRQGKEAMEAMISQLKTANENTWMLIGTCTALVVVHPADRAGAVSEQISSPDDAAKAFDRALKHNPNSILALNAAANLARSRDKFDEAVDLFQRILNIKQDNGEVWGSMGELASRDLS
jgi:tetratricopeptide (TPR) repeat protein